MAGDINRVVLVGRLTRDPEVKSTNSGMMIARFSLASNRYVYNKETGEGRDEAGFFDCVVFGKKAETASKYLSKGDRIGIEGSLKFSSWENRDGKKVSKIEIMVESFQFLENKKDSADNRPSQGSDNNDGFHSGGESGSFYSGENDDIPF